MKFAKLYTNEHGNPEKEEFVEGFSFKPNHVYDVYAQEEKQCSSRNKYQIVECDSYGNITYVYIYAHSYTLNENGDATFYRMAEPTELCQYMPVNTYPAGTFRNIVEVEINAQ